MKLRLNFYKKIIIAALVMLLALQPASAFATSDLQTKVDALTAIGIPGAQVNVNGLRAVSGVADITTNRAMADNLKFRIGSLSKSFTAAVALQLAAENKLSLDGDSVEEKLPGLLPYGHQVTLRMLMQHTSGIPDYWEGGPDPLVYSFVNDPAVRNQSWTPQQLINRVSSEPALFTPGSSVEYSSTDTVILGLIIEQTTGRTLKREVKQRIVEPLNLHNTSFPLERRGLPDPFTKGYTYLFDTNGEPQAGTLTDISHYDPSALWAMGNMVSTTRDLNRFYKALLGGELLPTNLTAEMKVTRPLTNPDWPEGIGMGLGIWSWDLPCGSRIYGHEGEVPGSNIWSFGTADGSRVATLQHNLLYPTWDMYFDTIMPTYFSLWCENN